MKKAAEIGPDYFGHRAEEIGLSVSDIVFQLAKLDVQVTGQAVRNWLDGKNAPVLAIADALASVLKTDRQTILEAAHAIATARAAAAK